MGSVGESLSRMERMVPGDERIVGAPFERGDAAVLKAARAVTAAQMRCMAAFLEDRTVDPDYGRAAAARLAALQALVAAPAASVAALEVKRDIFVELEGWIGPEDSTFSGLLMQILQEAIGLLKAAENLDETTTDVERATPRSNPARWLMDAAASVPAYIVGRRDLG
ncbi:hypothetical protein Acid7E03_38890 [Acidisoma sp. 7E03]